MHAHAKSVLIWGLPVLLTIGIPAWAGTADQGKLVEQPSTKTTEPWEITVGGPGWLAGVSGYTGFLFAEAGYRYYYDDFRDNGFLYQLSLHDAQITVGLKF